MLRTRTDTPEGWPNPYRTENTYQELAKLAVKLENTFLSRIRKKLIKAYPEIEVFKMHNNYIGGIADWYMDGPGGDAWVEGKYVIQAKLSVKPQLTPLQLHFLQNRKRNGKNAIVLLGTEKGSLLYLDPFDDPLKPYIGSYLNDDLIVEFFGLLCGGHDNCKASK